MLPILRNKIAAYNWGLVAGKTQTNLPWDSWEKPYNDREPANWFHEIFLSDGKPYRSEEVDFIKEMIRSQADSSRRSRNQSPQRCRKLREQSSRMLARRSRCITELTRGKSCHQQER